MSKNVITTNIRRFGTRLLYCLFPLILTYVLPLRVLAQDEHSHSQHEMTPEQQKKAGALIKIVRDSTSASKM